MAGLLGLRTQPPSVARRIQNRIRMSQHASSGYHCELKDGGVACPTGKNDRLPAWALGRVCSLPGRLILDYERGVSELVVL